MRGDGAKLENLLTILQLEYFFLKKSKQGCLLLLPGAMRLLFRQQAFYFLQAKPTFVCEFLKTFR